MGYENLSGANKRGDTNVGSESHGRRGYCPGHSNPLTASDQTQADNVYVRSFKGSPWPRLPVCGEMMGVAGNYFEVEDVYFELDGTVQIYLDIGSHHRDCWDQDLQAQGFQMRGPSVADPRRD